MYEYTWILACLHSVWAYVWATQADNEAVDIKNTLFTNVYTGVYDAVTCVRGAWHLRDMTKK